MGSGIDVACCCNRPAAAEPVAGAAPTAIPAHVDAMGDDHTRYLVSIKPALVPTNSSRLLGSRGSRRSSLLLHSARQPFDDVKLGPLLGKGGFGRVYRAVWNGAAVACKVSFVVSHFALEGLPHFSSMCAGTVPTDCYTEASQPCTAIKLKLIDRPCSAEASLAHLASLLYSTLRTSDSSGKSSLCSADH